MQEQDIREPFLSLWKGKDFFKEAFSIEGQEFRSVKNRRTLRFELDGKAYFIKRHGNMSWREILKNFSQFKVPVWGADSEYRAILKLGELGVETMTIRAYGMRGSYPAGLESFLITDELQNKISLEDFTLNWSKEPPCPELKHRLIRELAEICSKMHFSGMNHRDCYLCHFLLDQQRFRQNNDVSLTVLDLHRAQLHSVIPFRMRIKDLAGIFFSSMDLGLNKTDMLRFIAIYSKGGQLDRNIWGKVWKEACRLYRKEFGKSCIYEQGSAK